MSCECSGSPLLLKQQLTTETPPTLFERDGSWFVRVVAGELEITAPVGRWFAAEFFTRVVVTQLVLDAHNEKGR